MDGDIEKSINDFFNAKDDPPKKIKYKN